MSRLQARIENLSPALNARNSPEGFSVLNNSDIVPSASPDRKGIRMSARSGQRGWIEERNGHYDARFWDDVEGRSTRLCRRVRICPVEGPGALTESERSRRLLQILNEHHINDDAKVRAVSASNLGITFQQQSERWLESIQQRKRKPVKPHTASTWKSHLRWINERIGPTPLCDVSNAVLRDLVAEMSPDFAPKTIANYAQVVKMVVASAIDSKTGDELFPRKWNSDFIDLPVVGEQRTPMFTADDVANIITETDGQFRVLYALLAGSGLRIGEALALKVEDIDGSVVRVRHGLWNGKLQSPKTKSGLREVDLHSSLADALHAHIAGRISGFVFASEAGGSLHQSNVLRRSLHPVLAKLGKGTAGFHGFRRYRLTWLRKMRVPENLVRYWIGHAGQTVSDRYDKIHEDVEFRRFTAEQAGLGFQMPVAPIAPRIEVSDFAVSA